MSEGNVAGKYEIPFHSLASSERAGACSGLLEHAFKVHDRWNEELGLPFEPQSTKVFVRNRRREIPYVASTKKLQ